MVNPFNIPCSSILQDKKRVYYPRIGDDLIDYVAEIGGNVMNFDVSNIDLTQFSFSELTNISLTGICVSGEKQIPCSLTISSNKSVFRSLFFLFCCVCVMSNKWFLQSVQNMALSFARIHTLKNTPCPMKSMWPHATVGVMLRYKMSLFSLFLFSL